MSPTTSGERPFLSVVVMGYHNEATIAAAVASLVDQRTAVAYEVVVVMSGGDESAAAVRRRFPGIPVAESPTRLLPGGARNAGVAMTAGEVVAFLAADCVALPGWIEARSVRHRDGAELVAGAMTAALPAGGASWAHAYLLYAARLPGQAAGPVELGSAGAHGLSFTRSLLDRLGPFDDSVLLGEDTDAALRARELGASAWFDPAVITGHTGPATTPALLTDLWRRGRTAYADPDAKPLLTRRAVAGAAAHRCRSHLRRTAARVRSNACEGQPSLWRVSPWVVAGAVSLQLGWARTQLRRLWA